MFDRRTALVGLSAAAFIVSGCRFQPARFGAEGYRSRVYHYTVGYADPGAKALLPAPWRLDNFNRTQAGFEEKLRGSYVGTRMTDEDADGEISQSETHREAIFDLKFLSQQDNGVIWAKAHPMRFVDRDRALNVIVDNYVESLSGTGLYTEGSVFSVKQTKERTFTSIVRERRNLLVDGHPAIEVAVEIVESEKLRADPNCRRERLQVVFTRFQYVAEIDGEREANGWPVTEGKRSRYESRKRGILVLGYANTTDAFDAAVPAFRDLVGRVRFPGSDASSLPPASPVASVGPGIPPPASAPQPGAPAPPAPKL